MKMRLKTGQNILQSFFVILFCVAIPIFFSYAFASGTETWYTDFEITSQEAVSTSSGQTTGSYTWSLTNHDTDAIEGEFYFVDAVPLVNGYYACKADNQSGVFGQYLQMDGSTNFYVQSGKTITGTINFDFPASYSGTYHGCIVYSVRNDLNTGGDVVMNMSSRKAKKVSVTLQASEVGIRIIANLGGRANPQTSNNNGYESKGKILFYDTSDHDIVVKSGYIVMDREGHGELIGDTILAGTYDVVYKSWQHLASYIPNVTISEGDTLSFVIGNNLTGVDFFEQLEQFKYNSGRAYQVAGDLPDGSGKYDFQINGTDLTVLWSDTLCSHYGEEVAKPNICDINNDGVIDSNDDTAILKYLPATYNDMIYGSSASFGFSEDSFGTVNYRDFDENH